MRKQTLASVCFILSIVIVFLIRSLARSQGIHLPVVGLVSPIVASFIIVPLLIIPLTALNQYILAWRKEWCGLELPRVATIQQGSFVRARLSMIPGECVVLIHRPDRRSRYRLRS